MLSKSEFDQHFERFWRHVQNEVKAGVFPKFLPPSPDSGEREVVYPVTDVEINIRTFLRKQEGATIGEPRFEKPRPYLRSLIQDEFYRIYTHPLAAGGELHTVQAFRESLKVNGKQGPFWIKQLAEFKREFYNRFVAFVKLSKA